MFTGIITGLGQLIAKEPSASGQSTRWWVAPPDGWLATLSCGESIAHDGVCLTVTALDPVAGRYEVELGPETLRATNLGDKTQGWFLNLERALAVGDRLGGHWVTGHVDGVAKVASVVADGENLRVDCELPLAWRGYVVAKGSLTLSGVSLTINRVEDSASAVKVSVSLLPYTYNVTNLRHVAMGDRLNVEVDLLGKYIERMMTAWRHA